jgi:hypothetical protein
VSGVEGAARGVPDSFSLVGAPPGDAERESVASCDGRAPASSLAPELSASPESPLRLHADARAANLELSEGSSTPPWEALSAVTGPATRLGESAPPGKLDTTRYVARRPVFSQTDLVPPRDA